MPSLSHDIEPSRRYPSGHARPVQVCPTSTAPLEQELDVISKFRAGEKAPQLHEVVSPAELSSPLGRVESPGHGVQVPGPLT